MTRLINRFYNATVLTYPRCTIGVLLAILCWFAVYMPDFRLDASADSLMLEDDSDLLAFRKVSSRYEIKEFVVVTYEPQGDLFGDDALQALGRMRDELRRLACVDSVVSILDVPLLRAAGLKLSEITSGNIKRLTDPTVDRDMARRELLASPVYRNLLIGADGDIAAIIVYLKTDESLKQLIRNRSLLIEKRSTGRLTAAETAQLQDYETAYLNSIDTFNEQRHADIAAIRSIIAPYNSGGRVMLGGVPMIADDMITFIKKDLSIFGIGVFLFIVATLTLIFRRVRWVVLPLLCCFMAVAMMIGILGCVQWKVTVISSNFISLMLILTMSMNIHLAVRYRQLCGDMVEADQREVVATTMQKMIWPCLYTALTTILAFCSLVFSGIRPVIDFGWMMTIGLVVTFLISFLLFPAVLLLLPRSRARLTDDRQSLITALLARIAGRHGGAVLACAAVLAVISVLGICRLKVENSFINYFQEDTEIYQGLQLIDNKLGGTTPLDVIIHFNADPETAQEGEEEDDFGWAGDYDPRDYWFTPCKIDLVKKIHDYFDSLPEVGKVLSLASLIRVAEQLNDGEAFDGIELGVLSKKIPDSIKSEMLDPYISIEHNEARISMRVMDSFKNIRRNELLQRIRRDLTGKLGLAPQDVTITGLLVLYNNMLQSLFRSQILTIGIVLLGIGAMLLVLFRSVTLAIVGIVPNILAVSIVLGIMGLCNIPLDLMTITIAAITMGIAIDNSIHYIYRFKEEFLKSGDYESTVLLCHGNVGKAILNTSVTIIFGFSILVFSNFIPTIYFGIFTGLAMFIALLSVLTLMPKLIYILKPFKIVRV